jgi:methylisocitrate lyase
MAGHFGAMPASVRVEAFRRLHRSGCFVVPNPWDLGSARLLAGLGFPALATTSSGLAWSLGRTDNSVSLEAVLDHLKTLAAGVDVPVSADFEDGFAEDADGVARNVTLAVATGIAGLSIEDSRRNPDAPLYDYEPAVARVQAARRAIDASGTGVVLTARSEGFVAGRPDLHETIRRLKAYVDAGADCVFAPGIRDVSAVAKLVQAVAPKPVNALVGSDFATVADLAAIGVRRISVGGALARAAWRGFVDAAREIAERGTFTGLARALPSSEIEGAFSKWSGRPGPAR